MKNFFFLLFFTLTLLLNSNVHAASDGISKQQAADIATQQHPGRVLGVKRKADVYKVKILSDSGKVRVIQVDAKGKKNRSGKKSGR
ncbi:MAG: PepSY domain-containing protein [Gammaproteobacteria bacterium]|nr:PepSY domain-containing protein [Gammaproteobacteria bacterium]